MNFLKRSLWAGIFTTVATASLQAQTLGGGAGGGGATGGGATGGGATGALAGGASGAGGGAGGGANAGINIAPPTINALTPTTSQAIAGSNIFTGFYANPLFQGRAGVTAANSTPGGFGVPLYGTTGSSPSGVGGTGGFGTGGTGAAGGGRTGTTGSTGFGGTTGAAGGRQGGIGGAQGGGFGGGAQGGGFGGGAQGGGFGAQGGFGNQQNTGLQSSVAISYTATPKFTFAALTPVQLQGTLQSVISSSTQMSSRAGVQVETQNGGIVVLRGTVADDDELRLVEGMIRLTPGVRDVKNELKIATAPQQP